MNLENKIQELQNWLTLHIEEELVRDTEMSTKIDAIDSELRSLKEDIQQLLNLWEQARGMLTLVRWGAAIAAFLLSINTFFKGK